MSRLTMYSPFEKWKNGDDLDRPYVYVMVDEGIPENGHTLLGRQLMNDREIDEIVGELKSDLDKFSKEAKRELERLRNKMAAK